MTDEWGAYNNLKNLGYYHSTVCHKKYFVDPRSGVNTQRIENSWLHLKKKIRNGGVTPERLEHHLAEYSWKYKQKRNNNNFFEAFLDLLKLFYGI